MASCRQLVGAVMVENLWSRSGSRRPRSLKAIASTLWQSMALANACDRSLPRTRTASPDDHRQLHLFVSVSPTNTLLRSIA